MITVNDRLELRLFELYLQQRAEKPNEDKTLAYGEIYGEVVFEDKISNPKIRGTSWLTDLESTTLK